MHLLEPNDYYGQLQTNVPLAKKRITLAAMVIVAHGRTLPIFDMLEAALARGVKVTVLVDIFYRSWAAKDERRLSAWRAVVRETDKRFARLQAKGASISYFGRLGINPFQRRCHVKVTVIDDRVFSFGGINFTPGSFESADYMLTTKNDTLADSLVALVDRIASRQPSLPDQSWQHDSHSAVLFDGGNPGTSVIYERARELASRAKRIIYVSQMVPSGPLAAALRHTEHTCYYNRPDQGKGFLKLSLYVDGVFSSLHNNYGHARFIHAKCMLFELHDGTRALISGSHNFSWRGVAYGTQEIALYSTDESLWEQLRSFVDRWLT